MIKFQKQRKNFINRNINNINKIELKFLKEYNITEIKRNCGELRNKYIKHCDKTGIIEDIDEFYDTDWFTDYSDKINHLDYKILKELISKLNNFKMFLKVDILYKTSNIENNLYECIKNRILYKYNCVLKQNRDKEHDAEVLRQIFNFEKLQELIILFKNLKTRYEEMKKERQYRREEEYKRREEEDKTYEKIDKIYYGSSSTPYEDVKRKRSKKRKRYSKHKKT